MNTCLKLIFACILLCLPQTIFAGAWGYDSFGNDDAEDWISNSLVPAHDTTVLEKAVNKVVNKWFSSDTPDCSAAIAACEVIAALGGKPAVDLPEEVQQWVARVKQVPSADLRKSAKDALERILKKSEMRDLWGETPDFEKWKATLEDLKKRL